MTPAAPGPRPAPAELARRLVAGDRRALSRAITAVENGGSERLGVLRALPRPRGKAQIVGITGAPGAGKSTLVAALAAALRDAGRAVAVVAVDPSSPFTGGALLGDRIRMGAGDGLFIRSLASRGHLGGLSRATGDVLRLLDAAGFERVLLETVGAGQGEVEVMRLAHTTLVVTVPGLGDDVQAGKAGILEIGDIFVVNKRDLPGAERAAQDLLLMLMLATPGRGRRGRAAPVGGAGAVAAGEASGDAAASAGGRAAAGGAGAAGGGSAAAGDATASAGGSAAVVGPGAAGGVSAPAEERVWHPPVLRTAALTGAGVPELVAAIEDHGRYLRGSGLWERRRLLQEQQRFEDALRDGASRWARRQAQATGDLWERVQAAMAAGDLDAYAAAEEVLAAVCGEREPVAPGGTAGSGG